MKDPFVNPGAMKDPFVNLGVRKGSFIALGRLRRVGRPSGCARAVGVGSCRTFRTTLTQPTYDSYFR